MFLKLIYSYFFYFIVNKNNSKSFQLKSKKINKKLIHQFEFYYGTSENGFESILCEIDLYFEKSILISKKLSETGLDCNDENFCRSNNKSHFIVNNDNEVIETNLSYIPFYLEKNDDLQNYDNILKLEFELINSNPKMNKDFMSEPNLNSDNKNKKKISNRKNSNYNKYLTKKKIENILKRNFNSLKKISINNLKNIKYNSYTTNEKKSKSLNNFLKRIEKNSKNNNLITKKTKKKLISNKNLKKIKKKKKKAKIKKNSKPIKTSNPRTKTIQKNIIGLNYNSNFLFFISKLFKKQKIWFSITAETQKSFQSSNNPEKIDITLTFFEDRYLENYYFQKSKNLSLKNFTINFSGSIITNTPGQIDINLPYIMKLSPEIFSEYLKMIKNVICKNVVECFKRNHVYEGFDGNQRITVIFRSSEKNADNFRVKIFVSEMFFFDDDDFIQYNFDCFEEKTDSVVFGILFMKRIDLIIYYENFGSENFLMYLNKKESRNHFFIWVILVISFVAALFLTFFLLKLGTPKEDLYVSKRSFVFS